MNLTTSLGYNSRGDVTSITDPNGNTSTFEYDLMRRRTKATAPSPFGFETKFYYNYDGFITKLERETGDISNPWQTTDITYTLTGKRDTVTDPLSRVTSYDYDDANRLWRITDAELQVITFAYDDLHRISTVTDPRSVVARTNLYTDNGFPMSVEDANGNITSFTYDGFDRLKIKTSPDATFEQYTYDANGNLTTCVKRSGDEIVFEYDVLNRMTEKAPDNMPVVSYVYDLAGRISEISKPVVSGDPSSGAIKLYYDSAGRFYKEEYPDSKTVEHVLDDNGNVTKTTWPDSYYVESEFDEMNRLTDIKLNGSTTSALIFDYDNLSRRMKLTYGNGVETDYEFDLADNLSLLKHTFTSASVQFDFGYDDVDQLIDQQVDNNGFMWNPLSSSTVGYGTANSLNQYPAVDSVSYSYNLNGCLIDDGIWDFVYDNENHLLSADSGTVTASYVYDPMHRQSQKEVNSAKTRFLYSGSQRIADYDGSGNLIKRFIFGPGIDEPLIELDASNNPTFLHSTKLGSIVATTDDNGDVVTKFAYSPFGTCDDMNGTSFGFTGQRFDPETGLYYYKARIYSTAIGRFLQPDPVEGSASNLYTYAANSPLLLRDPTGAINQSENQGWGNNGWTGYDPTTGNYGWGNGDQWGNGYGWGNNHWGYGFSHGPDGYFPDWAPRDFYAESRPQDFPYLYGNPNTVIATQITIAQSPPDERQRINDWNRRAISESESKQVDTHDVETLQQFGNDATRAIQQVQAGQARQTLLPKQTTYINWPAAALGAAAGAYFGAAATGRAWGVGVGAVAGGAAVGISVGNAFPNAWGSTPLFSI